MIDSLKPLFIEQLKDLYHAENQLLAALPNMSVSAQSAELKKVLETHLDETRDQVERLKQVFKLVDVEPEERKCKAMTGLIAEADEIIKECSTPQVRDAAIIASAQRIQHYELAGYGTARTYAEMLGEDEAARILQTTLDEEGRTDEVLTDLAKKSVNREAVAV